VIQINSAVKELSAEVCGPPAVLRAGELAELSQFLTSVFGGDPNIWREWFEHWWLCNPIYDAAMPRGWIMRAQNGAMIAFTANIPFRYVIAGKSALCCATGSTAVDQNWRGLGLAKSVGQQFVRQAEADLLVGIDSTPAAFKLWRGLGLQSLQDAWLETHSRIMADGLALGATVSRMAHLPEALGYAAGRSLAVWLDTASASVHRPKSLTVAHIESFTEADAEDLANCRASEASIYAWKDVATLNWLHFGSQYLKSTRIVVAARAGAKLVGYLAMKRRRHSQYPGHSYSLLECRCKDADPGIARQLIWAARACAQQDGAQSIIVRPYTRMIAQAIPKRLSLKLSRPEMTYCYHFKSAEVSAADWEAGPGDGDASVT
jgi:hypothetical protein